jgi:predicted 2-oxoglutarate/Fe(II)-dependent dioxygenase YbiX
MFTESFLHSHKDDRNWDEPIEDLASMTYVCGLFLTDDYEGGELTFEDYDISLKPKPGTLVLFPGYYTRHGVNKVTSGTRINILSHFFDIIDRDNINSSYM